MKESKRSYWKIQVKIWIAMLFGGLFMSNFCGKFHSFTKILAFWELLHSPFSKFTNLYFLIRKIRKKTKLVKIKYFWDIYFLIKIVTFRSVRFDVLCKSILKPNVVIQFFLYQQILSFKMDTKDPKPRNSSGLVMTTSLLIFYFLTSFDLN